MASLSEMVQYAQAKQKPNGLAEIAKHFLAGASSGYDAAKKAKLDSVNQILAAAKAEEAAQKARGLKIQNDIWNGLLDQGKAQGDVPLTAGETMNGRMVLNNSLGANANTKKPTNALARLASYFMPKEGGRMTTRIKSPLGDVTIGPENKTPESSQTAKDREDRILREKAFGMALKMTQAEDPMAAAPNPKYLRTAYEGLGKNPDDYIKKQSLTLPANNDPWGLLGQGGQ